MSVVRDAQFHLFVILAGCHLYERLAVLAGIVQQVAHNLGHCLLVGLQHQVVVFQVEADSLVHAADGGFKAGDDALQQLSEVNV